MNGPNGPNWSAIGRTRNPKYQALKKEDSMSELSASKIQKNPKYHRLIKERDTLA